MGHIVEKEKPPRHHVFGDLFTHTCMNWKPKLWLSSQPICQGLVAHCRDAKSATQPPCLTWRSHSREDVQTNDMLLVHPSPHSVVQGHLNFYHQPVTSLWGHSVVLWRLRLLVWSDRPTKGPRDKVTYWAVPDSLKYKKTPRTTLIIHPCHRYRTYIPDTPPENKYEAVPFPLESSTPSVPWPTPASKFHSQSE